MTFAQMAAIGLGCLWLVLLAAYLDVRKQRDRYRRLCLCVGDRKVSALVHRLALTAFAGPCPDGMECRHLDGVPGNNSAGNLAWGTKAENMADRAAHGTTAKGERHGRAKLTWPDVREIRGSHEPGKVLAERHGVCQAVISSVRSRKTWKHDPEAAQ